MTDNLSVLPSATEAWSELATVLARAGADLPHPPFPQGPRATAEGYRYLSRLAVMGIQWAMEFNDPDFPTFHRYDDDITKWGGPNVDNRYLRARIRGSDRYRITGDARSCHGAIFQTVEGDMQLEQYGVYAEAWVDRFETDADGTFELIVSPERQGRNWLPAHPDATIVTLREYFNDWENDVPGDYRIERIGSEGLAPAPLTDGEVARRLREAHRWVERSLHYWNAYIASARDRTGENTLAPPRSAPGGATDIAYGAGFYRLAPDEAMVVEGDTPDAWFWNYMLYTHGWMESLDFANHTTSLNGHQIRIDDDGRYRLVIAHHDPGTPNWLDTTGLPEAMISYRYVRTRTSPVPTCHVVPFDAVRAVLPADTPIVTVAQRRDEIAIRRRHVDLRFRR